MDSSGNEVPPSSTPIRDKWGKALGWGFVVVPAVLVKKQRDLGLDCEDLTLLIHLLARWWAKDERPFPRTETLAKRTGLGRRNVQRRLESLERRGFLIRGKTRKSARTPRQITEYDLMPLVRRLEEAVKTAAAPLEEIEDSDLLELSSSGSTPAELVDERPR